jgi:hypothetical protein
MGPLGLWFVLMKAVPFYKKKKEKKKKLIYIIKKRGMTGQKLVPPPNSVNGEPQNK